MHFETWCWRRMLKIKWTDKIMNDEIFKARNRKAIFKNFIKWTPLMDMAYN
jgi:hypothetical protein